MTEREKDLKKESHRRMTEEGDTKTENTFIVLQEEVTELLLEKKDPLPLNNIGQDKKKVNKLILPKTTPTKGSKLVKVVH